LLELGIVSGRVALLLRSAEIQPVFGRFSMNGIRHSPFLLGHLCYWAGLHVCGTWDKSLLLCRAITVSLDIVVQLV
jgi:hypothetical protein